MLIPGLDSAFPPNSATANIAYLAGYRWWGFYIEGVGNTDPLNAWTPGQEEILISRGFKPVPICIPSPPAVANPIQTATQAFESCKNYGLSPKIAICYNGSHIAVSGPVWLPIPEVKPTSVGSQSAIQFGGANINGLSVDLNVAASDFPFNEGIVCDLEHDTSYTSEWYNTFQTTIIQLANPSFPPISQGDHMFVAEFDENSNVPPTSGFYLVRESGPPIPINEITTVNTLMGVLGQKPPAPHFDYTFYKSIN
jgi:hypothetical protein